MSTAIIVDHVTKRFNISAISGHTTLKDAILKGQLFRMRQSRGYVEAVKDISFVVPEATVTGIIGPNGAGKSTLLRLLAKIYRPTAGKIQVNGRISALLGLGLGFHPEFSGRENIVISALALGVPKNRISEIAEDIIKFAELDEFIDVPVRTYSSGMYMRLAFSIAVNVNPEVLLIDEVLAVGDARFAVKSRARMEEFKKQGKTIVLATHDLNTAQEWCQQVIFLNGGQIAAIGKPAEVIAKYVEMFAGKPV